MKDTSDRSRISGHPESSAYRRAALIEPEATCAKNTRLPLKVMMIVMDEQRVILDSLYKAISDSFDTCTILRLDSEEQRNLSNCFKKHNPVAYDRVVIFSRLKRLEPQTRLLRLIPNLVFLEHDACQNYMEESHNKGAYTRFYKAIPGCRVISSGYQVSQALRRDGVDADFVAKGFDERLIKNCHAPRDISAAFIGSIKHTVYQKRKRMLEDISNRILLRIERTNSGADYATLLNRIRVFVNADSGMHEYMIKNFEAMAAGCILLTEDQGEEENEILGFRDMENVMLYRTANEAVNKLTIISENHELGDRIAKAGEVLAWEKFTFAKIGPQVAESIAKPLRPRGNLGTLDRWYARLFHHGLLVGHSAQQ